MNASSTSMSPPPDGDQDRGPYVVACCWVMAVLGIVVVTLRLAGRFLIRKTGLDDWTMLFTLVLFVIYAGFITYYSSVGGFRHQYYLSPSQRTEALQYDYLVKPWILAGFAFGKISVGFLILRILGPNSFWRKWSIYFFIGTAFLFNMLNLVFQYIQCNPVQALWDTQLLTSGQATCWSPSAVLGFAMFMSTWNVLVDVVLALLPASIVYDLKLKWPKKASLCLLLGLGLISAVFAGIKEQYVFSITAHSDLTWANYDLYLWSAAELVVIIVCGSIPPITPVWDRLWHHVRFWDCRRRGNGDNNDHFLSFKRSLRIFRSRGGTIHHPDLEKYGVIASLEQPRVYPAGDISTPLG